jgi:hypothetical protein
MSLHSSEHTAGGPLSLKNKEKDKDLPQQDVPNLAKNDDPALPEQDRGVTRIEALCKWRRLRLSDLWLLHTVT